MRQKILISGANGFIGRHLCSWFAKRDYEVYGLVRSIPEIKTEGIHYYKFDLKNIDESLFKPSFSVFIHAAYMPFDQHPDSTRINVEAGKKLYQLCLENDIHFIFLSSMSALRNAQSAYGRSKFQLEQSLDTNRCCIVRPGLVLGDGGLYQNMENWIKRSSFIPLFGNGAQIIQQIQVTDLCLLLQKIADQSLNGDFSFAEPEHKTIRNWYKEIANNLGKRIYFIPIPYVIADLLFLLLDILPLKLGVGRENYLGLKHMKKRQITDTWNTFGLHLPVKAATNS